MTVASPNSVWKAVVQRVAEHTAKDAIALPPIYEAIDPEALDRLVRSGREGDGAVSIQFIYAGHRIEVEQDGTIRCSPERPSSV